MGVRVQFDFRPEAVARLDHLVARLGAASRAEVVRRALALLDEATTEPGAKVEGSTYKVLCWPPPNGDGA